MGCGDVLGGVRVWSCAGVVDIELLTTYGLSAPATALLETVALWEIHSLLTGGLRLRTACDRDLVGEPTTRRGDPLPELVELTDRITELVAAFRDVFGDGAPFTVTWTPTKAGRQLTR